MIRSVLFSLIIFLLSLVVIPPAFAQTQTHITVSNDGEGASSDVNVHNDTGQNTICINGKCTTSSGTTQGKSTVCINGQCTTSDDGNVDVHQDNANVHINTSGTSNGDVQGSPSATITPNPTDRDANPEADHKVLGDAIKQEISEQHVKNQFDWGKLLWHVGTFVFGFVF
ncbi:MAG TPA: hypothetical protein VE090_03750 [Methylomirabilota bacterium]|nr:hypothetical protein [Methylomirabilota bacterium]